MGVTIKKIAEMSNVSTGTVDRVLNKRGKVKPEVEQRVLAIAKALDYKPNKVARGLALKNKNIKIGILFHVQQDYKNYAINESYEGIKQAEEEFSEFGITFIYRYCENFNVQNQIREIESLVDEDRVVALAITPLNDPLVSKALDSVIEQGIPVFCFINDISTNNKHYFIGIDNTQLGAVAAGLLNLLKKEYLHIGMVFPSLSLLGNQRRLKGFEQTVNSRYLKNMSIAAVCIATNDDMASYHIVKQMLVENKEINSIFFSSGAAEGGLMAIKEAGLLGKALIIAVDPSDIIQQHILEGNIAAAINQNTRKAGYLTIKLIFDYVMLGTFPEESNIVLQSDIIIKEHLSHMPVQNSNWDVM